MTPQQLERWIERLQQINQQEALPRRGSNKQRTTIAICAESQQMLKHLYKGEIEWRAVNRVLIGCLQFILEDRRLQPDLFVISRLQQINQRVLLSREDGDETRVIPVHKEAKALLTLLKSEFNSQEGRCRWHWQTFNHALMRCLNDNDRLIAACSAVITGGLAA